MTLPTNITVGDPGHAGIHNTERTAINAKPDDFVDLGDTPSSLAGEAGKVAVVNGAGTALELAVPAAAVLRAVNEQAASYTLVLADAAQAVQMNVASANNLTVPPNSSVAFPVGTMLPVTQTGAGTTTIVAGSGVTVQTPDTLVLAGQWSTVWLRKAGTDVWVLSTAGGAGDVPSPHTLGGEHHSADTLANLNSKVSDATLDDSSATRTPAEHGNEAHDETFVTAADLSVVTANVQTASYTLVLGDAGKAVEMNVASANNLTVPPNSAVAFPAGTVIEVAQVGAGQTTVVAGSGVTVQTPETLVLTGQWSTVSLRKRGTDEWLLAGDVEADGS